MHFIITDARLAKTRALHLSGFKLAGALAGIALLLMLTSAGLYHLVFLKGAREGWPIIGTLVRFVVRDEFEQRDRFMRENLDAMARRLGEMQARLVQLEALGDRVSGLAGMTPPDALTGGGRGGALVEGRPLTMEELQVTLTDLERLTGRSSDLMTVLESRLFDQKIRSLMVPTRLPVASGHLGSGFGWRIDPFTGRSALHTGLDFQAEPGTTILAAAGGIVVTQAWHSEYGNMIEIDHGNDLVTRYAHTARSWVNQGDVVRRGQRIADVGTTGRSTGPHLHFEVLVQGMPQDPQKFLAAGRDLPAAKLALADHAAHREPPER